MNLRMSPRGVGPIIRATLIPGREVSSFEVNGIARIFIWFIDKGVD